MTARLKGASSNDSGWQFFAADDLGGMQVSDRGHGIGGGSQIHAKLEQLADDVGRCIAERGHITVYGAEKDYDSLSTAASRGAKAAGVLTVGVTIFDVHNFTDVVIATGIERGGGREFVLVNSCHAIIIVAGGSGTLTEAAIAYRKNVPIVALSGTGGWADKLATIFGTESVTPVVTP
jgi:uncharacterized protein (TIGR00725 family)